MAEPLLQDFLDFLNENVSRSVYVWGGQGQYARNDRMYAYTGTLIGPDAEAWIRSKETSTRNGDRAVKTYRKIAAAYDGDIHVFDCSGLGTFYLYTIHRFISSDKNANGLKGMCQTITKDKLKPGDWVFRVYTSGSSKGRAYHVGYVVDWDLNVIEAKGRDYGVVKRPFDSKYWNHYGRPGLYLEQIEKEERPVKPIFTRTLKRTKPTMTGDDVRQLQLMLNEYMGAGLAVDGRFGPATEKQVKIFQKQKGLVVDGKCGPKTVAALGGVWMA